MADILNPDGSIQSRREERHRVGVPGKYRRGAGMPSLVQLLDLSKSGCRFYDRFGNLKPDTDVTIRIGDLGPIVAHVRWQQDSYVGVAFDPPLHDAILDHIRATYPAS